MDPAHRLRRRARHRVRQPRRLAVGPVGAAACTERGHRQQRTGAAPAGREIFNRPIADSDQWKKAIATGTFDAEHQFLIRYRQNGDADGYQVVTPLRTSTGALLVDRGFVSLPRGNQIPAVAPAPPTGTVTVEGYVRRNEQGSRAATQPANGQVRLINSDALQSAVPYPVANGYLSVLTVNPPQSGGFVPLPPPEINEGPHFWYALQWFMFAGIGILGIVVFIRADVRDRREVLQALDAITARRLGKRLLDRFSRRAC